MHLWITQHYDQIINSRRLHIWRWCADNNWWHAWHEGTARSVSPTRESMHTVIGEKRNMADYYPTQLQAAVTQHPYNYSLDLDSLALCRPSWAAQYTSNKYIVLRTHYMWTAKWQCYSVISLEHACMCVHRALYNWPLDCKLSCTQFLQTCWN